MIQIIKRNLSDAMEELSEYNPDEIDGLGTNPDLDNIDEFEEGEGEDEWGDE